MSIYSDYLTLLLYKYIIRCSMENCIKEPVINRRNLHRNLATNEYTVYSSLNNIIINCDRMNVYDYVSFGTDISICQGNSIWRWVAKFRVQDNGNINICFPKTEYKSYGWHEIRSLDSISNLSSMLMDSCRIASDFSFGRKVIKYEKTANAPQLNGNVNGIV